MQDWLAAVSVEVPELDLHTLFGEHARWYSPYEELRFSMAPELDRLALEGPFSVVERVSPRPIHEGYFAALELSPAATGDPRPAIEAFIARERERHAERSARACYGAEHPRGGGILYTLDHPAYDVGNLEVGFGLAVERWSMRRRWLWSRPVFFHK